MIINVLESVISYIWKWIMPNFWEDDNHYVPTLGAPIRFGQIARELGVNLSLICRHSSPIYDAIYNRDNERICMMLYNGEELEVTKMFSDGGLIDSNLSNTADDDFKDVIIRALFHYSTVSDDPDIEIYFHELLSSYSSIGEFLLESNSDRALVELYFIVILQLNPTVILNFEKPFLLTYVECCRFSTPSWLRGLNMLLELPCAADLVQQVVNYKNCDGIFSELIRAFRDRNIENQDRTAIIWTCLSFGAIVNVNEIITTINCFGYNEEVEALIYGFNSYGVHPTAIPPIITILSVEDDYNCVHTISGLSKFLKCFSLSKSMKENVLKSRHKYITNHPMLLEKLKTAPNCPSLIELSRNQTRKMIKQAVLTKQPYQYYENVKNLNIPETVKDIILLKKPLYNV